MIPVVLCAAALTGCKGSTDTSAKDAIAALAESASQAGTDEGTSEDTATDDKKTKDDISMKVDITSKRAVSKFIEGTWRLYDPIGDTTFATLEIDDVGNIVYTRDSDNLSAKGTLDISHRETYDATQDRLVEEEEYGQFEMHLYDVPEGFYYSTYESFSPTEEESAGDFHIARGEGSDRLLLQWIGNGDSFIFHEMFQNHDRMDEDALFQQTWMFVKDNGITEGAAKAESEDFYGYIWDRGRDGSLFVQKMIPHEYEAFEEYTNMHYMEGFFTEDEDIGITEYEMVADADTSGILHDTEFESAHPFRMYSFTTNGNGRITKISDVKESFYGRYDMGALDPVYSCSGTQFTVNGCVYDMTEYAAGVNAITDMYMVGDWLVVEGHMNPHIGAYCLFDIYGGQVSDTIVGANLTWLGDDITTAVYSAYENVYNIKHHVIYTVGTGEVESLKYSSDGTEVAIKTFDDREYICYPDNDDTAMFRLMDFERYRTAERWNAFMELAPDNAIAFVMIGPPEITRDHFAYLQIEEEVKEDCIYVVSLCDKMSYHIDTGDYDYENDRFISHERINEGMLDKGWSDAYAMMIAEGIPVSCLFVANEYQGGKFPIAMISGESDRCGVFVTASMTAKEALE